MRKWNGILTAVILVLFLVHAVLGSFQLFGVGDTALKTIARADFVLIMIHAAIGIKYTVDTLRAQKKAGVSYWRQNKWFWVRRISGFVIMILLLFHITAFGYTSTGGYRLRWFGPFRMTAQILLVLAIAVHVLSNLRPMLISFGIRNLKQWIGDLFVILSVLLLLMTAAFIIYYLRWNVW